MSSEESNCSISEAEGSQVISPPTSPVRYRNNSPPTPPVRIRHSPPTSSPTRDILGQQDSADDLDFSSGSSSPARGHDSSSTTSSGGPSSPPRKRNQGELSRSTLRRRQRALRHLSSSDHGNDVENIGRVPSPDARRPEEDATAGIVLPQPDQDNITLHHDASTGVGISDDELSVSSDSIPSSSSSVSSEENSDSATSSCTSSSSDESLSDSSSHDSDIDADDDINNFLFDGSSVTRNEAILRVLKLYISERWTKKSLDKNVKLIKSLLPQPNEMPSSSHDLFTLLNELTSSYKEIEHFYCENCQLPKSTYDKKCKCGCESSGIFYEIPLEDQIRHLFEQRHLYSLIDSHRINLANKKSNDDDICDIQDGSIYKSIKSQLKGQYDVVLLTNTDGVSLSSSSKQQFWGVLSTICEIPPKVRSSFVIVSGIYVGRSKPNMNMFFKPFVESLKRINLSGGVEWTHPVTQEKIVSKVVSPILCADAPAKAIVLNVKQYNSKFGCNSCEQKAVKVKTTDKEIVDPPRKQNKKRSKRRQPRTPKKKKRKRCFVFQEEAACLRTGPRMERQGKLAEERGKPRKGVIGSSVVTEAPGCDRALCVCAEYMHQVLLGVAKYFLSLMLFNKSGEWYIGGNIEDIDNFISKIKVPDFVKRLPRGVSEFHYFKASELRAFLLFYSIPAFQRHLPDKFMQHWLLLVGAMFILLSECISKQELKAANIMLRCFVRDIKELYGEEHYTYNVHTLLHLCLLVERWGPLWATSAFIFETFNGFVTTQIHGTKHIGKELLKNIMTIQNVFVLENMEKCVNLSINNRTELPAMYELLGKCLPLESDVLNDNERLFLTESGFSNNCLLVNRAKVLSELYTTKTYDLNKKRANSYVQFKMQDDSFEYRYGQILHFVKVLQSDSLLCLVDLYKVKHVDIVFHLESRHQLKNLVPVEKCKQFVIVPANCISCKVLLVGNYMCLRPNTIEVNL